jgi:hypothetical protein
VFEPLAGLKSFCVTSAGIAERRAALEEVCNGCTRGSPQRGTRRVVEIDAVTTRTAVSIGAGVSIGSAVHFAV